MTSSLSSSALHLSLSTTMGTTVVAQQTAKAEEVMDASLDEYFVACQDSSSSSVAASSRSSSLSEPDSASRRLMPSSSGATVRIGSSTTAARTSLPSPMQGSAIRPLLQRSQSPRDSLLTNVIISIPRTIDEDGTPPPDVSPPALSRKHSTPLPQKSKTAPPLQADATAPLREGAVVRGLAGHRLAKRLHKTCLPCAPTVGWCLPAPPSTADDSSAASPGWTGSAFLFSPLHATDTASVSRGKARSFITITTQGGSNRTSSSVPPLSSPSAAVRREVYRLARQRALLFDVLSALRQHPTASCEMCLGTGDGSLDSTYFDPSTGAVGGKWKMRDSVLAEAGAKMWSPTLLGALEQLLDMATVVATVDTWVRRCEIAFHSHVSAMPPEAHDTFGGNNAEDGGGIQEASVALEEAAARSLQRFCSVLRQLSVDFNRWVLQVQEYLLVLCEGLVAASHANDERWTLPVAKNVPLQRAARASLVARGDLVKEEEAPTLWAEMQSPFDAGLHQGSTSGIASTLLPPSCSLTDLVAAVSENILPLERCKVLIEESGCFDGLVGLDNSSSTSRTCSYASLAARLLDTLIIKASALQDTSTMDLYRFYVMLLLYTAWPYVLLCTAAIFGFVRGIDPLVWRRQLPRLFRSSFSHVRIGDVSRRCPTDILSLLLNCVGYHNAIDIPVTAGSGEKAAGVAQSMKQLPPSSTGPSDDSGGAPWVSAPAQACTGSRNCRRGDTSELHVARAALTSARVFVLRSLAGFLRRRRQVALSRTPTHPRRPRVALADGNRSTALAERSKPSNEKASLRHWHTMSVKEILHDIMFASDDQTDSGGVTTVVAYAQQNQDVRRRVVQVEAGGSNSSGNAGASHYIYFPTTIPLGFSAMLAEALSGQKQWRHQRHGRGASSAMNEQDAFTPSSRAPPPPQQQQQRVAAAAAADDDDDDDDGGSGVLRRRGISLWTLSINESSTTPDVQFTNALAEEAAHYETVEVNAGTTTSGHDNQEHGKRRSHQPWINVTIPCARWITTALLIPIGVTVQRLQERRLRDLFKPSLPAVLGGVGGNLSSSTPVETLSHHSSPPLPGLSRAELVGFPTATVQCTFMHALKLVVDVALCRDQERLIHGFLERLHREPRWWVRHAQDGGVASFQRLGTAAPVVSAIFSDALRGKRFSELVRLSVLPARGSSAAETKETPVSVTAASVQAGGKADKEHIDTSTSADIRDMFACFRLDFALPDALQRILRPQELSVYVNPLTSALEHTYEADFWQRRRRLHVREDNAVKERPPIAHEKLSYGIAFADVWSYIFGYSCTLCYAQITLREQKRSLRQRDTQDAQVAQAMGLPGRGASQHLQYASRGLGSAYYTLNFAVDQLLYFTQTVTARVVYDLQQLLANITTSSSKVPSCMDLCYQLDTLLLDLSFIAFPARPPVVSSVRERGMQSPAAEVVRAAVQRTLEVALDPSRLPASHIHSSTRNAVEALVAAVSAAAERHPSALAAHLQPLVVRLTFNRYYGTDEETMSFLFR